MPDSAIAAKAQPESSGPLPSQNDSEIPTRRPKRGRMPLAFSQQNAVTGIGNQRIIVAEGKVRHNVLGANSDPDNQSFIGIDPQRKILWLIAFRNATPKPVAETAASLDFQFGGRVDGGDSTTRVIGPAAKHVFPFTGLPPTGKTVNRPPSNHPRESTSICGSNPPTLAPPVPGASRAHSSQGSGRILPPPPIPSHPQKRVFF